MLVSIKNEIQQLLNIKIFETFPSRVFAFHFKEKREAPFNSKYQTVLYNAEYKLLTEKRVCIDWRTSKHLVEKREIFAFF